MQGPLERTWKVACPLKAQGRKLLSWILLDKQFAANSLGNKGPLSNIRNVNDSMAVMTNGGELTTNGKGCLAGCRDAWHHPDATTNVLSLSNVMKKQRVTFDCTEDGAFCVHKPDCVEKF